MNDLIIIIDINVALVANAEADVSEDCVLACIEELKFDRSDRKFVAVSAAHPDHPPILQAVDSKWWGWKEALSECGIEVIFLCPDDIAEKYAKKIGFQ